MDYLETDHPHDECGVIGVFAPHEDVARMTFFGLYALQHRGQEACGIAVSDGHSIRMHKDIGMVAQVFTPQNLDPLQGHYAIGHTRYSTTGSSNARNAQPFLIDTQFGPIAVGHNGNLVNATQLRKELMQRGVGMSSSSDSEVITMMLAGAEGATWNERIKACMRKWTGAYSLVILTRDGVFAVRDPWGFHPLSIGMLPSGGHAAASESGALETLGCIAIREVHPGEIVALSDNALRVHQALPPKSPLAFCTFESIYFSRPDSIWDGQMLHQVRQNLGRQLALEAAVPADVVIPVPDSSIPAAIGYSQESGVPYNIGFIKNRYIGRTFIQPTESLRQQGVALKFNVLDDTIRGKRVVMIDDSIVRGNTTGPLVRLLHGAGASEVHVRITCPPIVHPCFMGVDMGTYEQLISHRKDLAELRQHLGCTSLQFLSLEGMMRAMGSSASASLRGTSQEENTSSSPEGDSASRYCNACFTGQYPFDINFEQTKTGFEGSIS
jgi:amidophosphoribosyltransferase